METNLKSSEIHERLQSVRDALLKLHKTLVDSETATYEKTFGKIPSPNHLLRLLTTDPWFAWLHPISLLIVSMDEALDKKEPLTADKVNALVKESAAMLVASETSEGFARHYFDALQRDPDVVFAHAEAAKLFKPKKTSA